MNITTIIEAISAHATGITVSAALLTIFSIIINKCCVIFEEEICDVIRAITTMTTSWGLQTILGGLSILGKDNLMMVIILFCLMLWLLISLIGELYDGHPPINWFEWVMNLLTSGSSIAILLGVLFLHVHQMLL